MGFVLAARSMWVSTRRTLALGFNGASTTVVMFSGNFVDVLVCPCDVSVIVDAAVVEDICCICRSVVDSGAWTGGWAALYHDVAEV